MGPLLDDPPPCALFSSPALTSAQRSSRHGMFWISPCGAPRGPRASSPLCQDAGTRGCSERPGERQPGLRSAVCILSFRVPFGAPGRRGDRHCHCHCPGEEVHVTVNTSLKIANADRGWEADRRAERPLKPSSRCLGLSGLPATPLPFITRARLPASPSSSAVRAPDPEWCSPPPSGPHRVPVHSRGGEQSASVFMLGWSKISEQDHGSLYLCQEANGGPTPAACPAGPGWFRAFVSRRGEPCSCGGGGRRGGLHCLSPWAPGCWPASPGVLGTGRHWQGMEERDGGWLSAPPVAVASAPQPPSATPAPPSPFPAGTLWCRDGCFQRVPLHRAGGSWPAKLGPPTAPPLPPWSCRSRF